jgi:hypothetical protein
VPSNWAAGGPEERAGGGELEAGRFFLQPHAGPEVREPEGRVCPQDGERVGGVEREEPEALSQIFVCRRFEGS